MISLGLYPRGKARPTKSRAEIATYEALRKALPEGWIGWHSLRIRTRGALEGEGDFVFYVPGKGVLLLEVKGGQLSLVDGQWLQNGSLMNPPPRRQMFDYRDKLVKRLLEHGIAQRDMPYIAIAVLAPDTGFEEAPALGDLEGIFLGKQDFLYFREALVALAERVFTNRAPPADFGFVEALHGLWGETWTPRLEIGTRTALRKMDLVALDREQLALLDLVDDNDRMLVTGGPGTGKTLLARDMIDRLARRGRRPLYLCFTDALAAGLRAGGIADASTVRDLAAKVVEDEGVKLQDGAPRDEWTSETWETALSLAACAADAARVRAFDAVVVDEAQDFDRRDWDLVRAVAGRAPLWAFGDPGQRFWEERRFPEDTFPTTLKLRAQYRCPEKLAAFADLYREDAAEGASSKVAMSKDQGLDVIVLKSGETTERMVAEKIASALDHGAAPSDIVVLSLGGKAKTELCAKKNIGKIPVARADAADAERKVVADTFLRFKGLERPLVIVTELGRGENRYSVRMHIALTRATVQCVVVATEGEVAKDGRLDALVGALGRRATAARAT